jgi:hypothetical protein
LPISAEEDRNKHKGLYPDLESQKLGFKPTDQNTEAGVLEKLSSAGLAKLGRLRWLTKFWFGLSRLSWTWSPQYSRPVYTAGVSPAYGYIKSALVKCSNEGGLGPRSNMKGDHGSSIFNRQVVYYLNLLTFSRNR